MPARPKSVTIIAWILIVAGVLALFLSTLSLGDPAMKEALSKSPIPIPFQLVLMYAGLGLSMASGIGMLKAKEWSRLLYTGWGVLSLTISTLTSPEKLLVIPGLVVFLIFVFFLFRPAATNYFTKKPQS
jgi:hypothetical protein